MMALHGLSSFIVDYIASRRQAKLDAFDKSAAKLSVADNSIQERQELEARYETRTWLTDAANRAGQISLVTHAAKYTHGDSKSSSVYSIAAGSDGYLCTAMLENPASDAVGNAAALDVARLLQTEVTGDSLLACLRRQDFSPFAALAENEAQLAQWVEGFSQALTAGAPSSHKLAKQIFFPVDAGYHLLSPLFSSSLAHALHRKLAELRFGEESKAIWQARKSGQWHEGQLHIFPGTAVMNFGGTKPQNISALNSTRRGQVWLLSARPPIWRRQEKPPVAQASLFTRGGGFDRAADSVIQNLLHLLVSTGDEHNVRIRRRRDSHIDTLIDLLFSFAADIQREEWQGWTLGCRLPRHQQLWLDPWRSQNDDAFWQEREKDEWQNAVAEDFALWLNGRMKKMLPGVGNPEKREWETRPLFRQRLREMEQLVKEGLS